MATAPSAFPTPQTGHFHSMTVGEIARLLDAQVLGDPATLITGVAGLDATAPGTISFIEDEKLLAVAMSSSAAAIIAPESMWDTLEPEVTRPAQRGEKGRKPMVFTGNPRLAFAKVMEFMQPVSLPEKGVHPTAIIEKDAHIGVGVTIREGCYVGHHAHIGDGAILYPHVVVGDGAQIGDATVLFPSVVLYHHVHIGKRVRIHSGTVIGGDGFGYVSDGKEHHKVPQVGTVIIEDDVEIGANVTIDRATMGATRIGEGTKIDNLVQIAHNVQIGRNCILCGQVGLSGSVVVEDDVVMAGQAGLRDHVKIGKGAILGAKAGIMSDVKAGEFVLGAPALPQREYMKTEAASRKLPEMARTLRRLERMVEDLQTKLADKE
jgi:UDP-3-O-[3-hydroxymyristoyl] glucosamine N-acyltransferase